ncbi:acyl carrier protein 1, chloroplastic-like protein [Tanacetum coccineum]
MHAKQDTVDKVCGIVRKQLAPKYDILVTRESKFYSLGADSLDTVLHTFIGSFIYDRPPELIGKLSDEKLHAGNKGTSEEELELSKEIYESFRQSPQAKSVHVLATGYLYRHQARRKVNKMPKQKED